MIVPVCKRNKKNRMKYMGAVLEPPLQWIKGRDVIWPEDLLNLLYHRDFQDLE